MKRYDPNNGSLLNCGIFTTSLLVTAVIKIGRMMTNITEVLVQIQSNKREGKKHLAQG